MQDTAIQQKIASFPRWHYQFDLNGHLTPILHKRYINRHEQRKRYFFDPVVSLFGGSLKGKRVLDLGCNAGFWSLSAIESGCDFVLGVDGRKMHIDQANFVFQTKNINRARYEFLTENIFDMDFSSLGSFDIVLCLGLMYHVSKPMELIEKIAQINSDMLIIDTRLSKLPASCFEVRRDRLDEPMNAVDYELVMFPTRQAILDMVEQFGYSAAVLKPRFQRYTGALDYWLRIRRAFLCAKVTPVSRLTEQAEPVNLYTQFLDYCAWRAGKLARSVSRQLSRRST